MVEKVYSQDRWWEAANDGAKSPENTLKAVIWALRHKDQAALLKTLDSKMAQVDPHLKLNGRAVGPAELAELTLKQFELVAVPRAYEFDDQAVFLARVRPEQSVSFLPLHFAREADGSFGFVLGGSKKLTYDIVQDWFHFYKSWGGPGNDQPRYCPAGSVKDATHKVSLFCTMGLGSSTSPTCKADDEKIWNRSQLFLSGVSLDTPANMLRWLRK